jgi:hypothetical protein
MRFVLSATLLAVIIRSDAVSIPLGEDYVVSVYNR